ncbi:hypothetical protein BU24DRAFT_141535 [Aaosphaeria arxii CBS 175.79]|uniref:Uncharacterized protein n=1 Tax=Aaosphaeria arxii CBS 175.79 TaxID=1450172 RepID=A0A6A5XXI2_9PLEO|nr:uncharacterized protein BU24DRAFT_141535 [Aaosphaeria arxii CBS 175.79]KAF2016984.1 hypothetical protein BU24DRAFT_141535 [Aaosphaeria arxii CBS 175.79]
MVTIVEGQLPRRPRTGPKTGKKTRDGRKQGETKKTWGPSHRCIPHLDYPAQDSERSAGHAAGIGVIGVNWRGCLGGGSPGWDRIGQDGLQRDGQTGHGGPGGGRIARDEWMVRKDGSEGGCRRGEEEEEEMARLREEENMITRRSLESCVSSRAYSGKRM